MLKHVRLLENSCLGWVLQVLMQEIFLSVLWREVFQVLCQKVLIYLCSRLGQIKNSSHLHMEQGTHPMFSVALGFCSLNYTLLPRFPKPFHPFLSAAPPAILHGPVLSKVLQLSLPPQEVIPVHSTPYSNLTWTSHSSQYPFALLLDKNQKLQQQKEALSAALSSKAH